MNNPTRRSEVPHKCIQVSEEGFLGSTYTKTGKVLITAAAVYVARPTECASVAQGLFGGSGHRAEAHTRPAWTKIPTAPSAFPLLGAPYAPGNNPSPKRGKNPGGRPPEAGGNLQLPRHTRLDPYRPKCEPTTGEKCSYITAAVVSVAQPTERASVAQGLFGGSERRVGAHTHTAWPKIPTAPWAFSLLWAPPTPSKELKSRGRPSEAGGNLQLSKQTRLDPCRCQHDRPKCEPTTGESAVLYHLQLALPA